MRFLEEIYKRPADAVFVFDNCYDWRVTKSHPAEVAEKARNVIDMVYNLHVKNAPPLDFYGYRLVHGSKTYDMYVSFGTKSIRTRDKERPWMFRLDLDAAKKQRFCVV